MFQSAINSAIGSLRRSKGITSILASGEESLAVQQKQAKLTQAALQQAEERDKRMQQFTKTAQMSYAPANMPTDIAVNRMKVARAEGVEQGKAEAVSKWRKRYDILYGGGTNGTTET